jgi:hypothetical protein
MEKEKQTEKTIHCGEDWQALGKEGQKPWNERAKTGEKPPTKPTAPAPTVLVTVSAVVTQTFPQQKTKEMCK